MRHSQTLIILLILTVTAGCSGLSADSASESSSQALPTTGVPGAGLNRPHLTATPTPTATATPQSSPTPAPPAGSTVGWTMFTASGDTQVVYVSQTGVENCMAHAASEFADPFHPPNDVGTCRTQAQAYALLRSGSPDWMLFKKGDVWTGEGTGMSWSKSGRSATEPMLVGAYGVGARPKLQFTTDETGFYMIHPVADVALVGLNFETANRQWYQAPAGFISLGDTQRFLIEDCRFSGFATNIIVQAYSGTPRDITIRRNVIVDAWSATSHSQGIFSSNVEGLLIEENVFDHNGWRDGGVPARLTAGTWNAGTRLLTQTGAFSRYAQWHAGDTVYINGGLMTTGSIVNADGSATGTVFRGDASLSSVDNYYTGKMLKFTTGANPQNARTNRFQRVIRYVGATRQFTVTSTGDPFSPPANGDQFRIDVAGLFEVAAKVSDDALRLATTDLSPISLTAADITSGAGVQATVFNRSMYLSGGHGLVTTRRNIDANGASGGIQQRKGGLSEQNLFLRAPLGLSFGHAQNSEGHYTGVIRQNVLLGARDISDAPRGFGITLAGTDISNGVGIEVVDNIVAHNELGTNNLFAFELTDYLSALNLHDNIAYDWHSPAGGGAALHTYSTTGMADVRIVDNDFQQPVRGDALYNYENPFNPAHWIFSGNHYFGGMYFNRGNRAYSDWVTVSGETNSSYGPVAYPDPNRTIESYMGSLGQTATYDAFMAHARLQSKDTWNEQFTAISVINYIRQGFDRPVIAP